MSDYSKIIASLSPEKRALFELRLKKKGNKYNSFPLSFPQQRLWFLEQLDPGNSIYNIPSAVRLTGELNINALSQSINEIVKRHEILRTTFTSVNGQPIQMVSPKLELDLPIINLEEISDNVRESKIMQLASEEAERPFDLAKGPLFRTTLIRINEKEHVVIYNMHNISFYRSYSWSGQA